MARKNAPPRCVIYTTALDPIRRPKTLFVFMAIVRHARLELGCPETRLVALTGLGRKSVRRAIEELCTLNLIDSMPEGGPPGTRWFSKGNAFYDGPCLLNGGEQSPVDDEGAQ